MDISHASKCNGILPEWPNDHFDIIDILQIGWQHEQAEYYIKQILGNCII